MKTRKISLMLFLGVVVLLFYSCSFLRGSGSIVTDNKTICSNYASQPMSELEVGLVHKMIKGYERQQLTAIKASMKDDAESVWFDLETIKEYIYHLEMNAKNNNVSTNDLGLRFYYASYPDTSWNKYSDLSGLPITYKKRHTIIAVSTIRRGGLDFDFDPTNPLTYDAKLDTFDQYSDPTTKFPVIGASSGGRSVNPRVGVQNHGSLIPPGDPSQTSF